MHSQCLFIKQQACFFISEPGNRMGGWNAVNGVERARPAEPMSLIEKGCFLHEVNDPPQA
jgi:hypothetical protein